MTDLRDDAPTSATDSGRAIRVVAAVLRRRGRYLLAQRPAGKVHAGCWEFPGGKLEPGENSALGLRRELAEELGLGRVSVQAQLARLVGSQDVDLSVQFLGVRSREAVLPLEHSALGWFKPAEALLLPLAPLDRRFVAEYLSTAPEIA